MHGTPLTERERALEARVLALECVTEQLLGMLVLGNGQPFGSPIADQVEWAASCYSDAQRLHVDLPGVPGRQQEGIGRGASILAQRFWQQAVAQKSPDARPRCPAGQRHVQPSAP